MTLEEVAEEETRWQDTQNAKSKAVESLITVEETKKGKDPDVELKTRLDDDQIKIHSTAQMINRVLEMSEKKFATECVLGGVINTLERKSISKDGESRKEIVAISKDSDRNFVQEEVIKKEGFFKRLIKPKPKAE